MSLPLPFHLRGRKGTVLCCCLALLLPGCPLAEYTITASAGAGGRIEPSGAVTVAALESQTFVVTPEASHEVADVVVDGRSMGPVRAWRFDPVQKDHVIEAFFQSKALEELEVAADFSYDTTQQVELDITVYSPNGAAKAGVVVTVYEPVLEDGVPPVPLVRGVTDGSGQWTGDLRVPSFLEELRVDAAALGTSNSVLAPINDGVVRHVFGAGAEE